MINIKLWQIMWHLKEFKLRPHGAGYLFIIETNKNIKHEFKTYNIDEGIEKIKKLI